MKRIIVITGMCIMLCSVIFAAGAADQPNEFGNLQSDRRILIATENSNFKDKLVTDLVTALNDGNTYIKVIFHKFVEISTEDPAEYGAVLIINAGQKSIVRPWITDYLNSISGNDDNVILVTTIILNWAPDVEVDSITTASDLGAVSDLVMVLKNKINKLLG